MRKPYIAGNWKMNLDRASGVALAKALADAVTDDSVEVAVGPPFVYLAAVADAVKGSAVRVGGQNMYHEASGAFTGEVSAAMLQDVGCDFVILGHSERRHVLGETDEAVNKKVHAALDAGLDVILCVGETQTEREVGSTEAVVKRHVTEGLAGVRPEQMAHVTIAYEPVWAIGTGLTATPEQAGEVHQYTRGLLSGLYGPEVAEATRIQYGGSVKPSNAAELLAVPDIDGCLVGGASLKPDQFLPIIEAAKSLVS